MKKPNDKVVTAAKIVAGAAMVLTLGANLTGCVYGPPPDRTSVDQSTVSESNDTTDPDVDQSKDENSPTGNAG